jgi:Tfp pilus assembly protein PilO
MFSRLINNIHLLIIAYSLWNAWEIWKEHSLVREEVINELPLLKARVAKIKKDKIKVKSYLKDIEKAKQRMKIVEDEVASLQKKLPEAIQDTLNLEILKNVGQSVNIKNVFLAPGNEKDKGFYFAKKYDFTGSGTYLQFLLFFEKLASIEQLFNVSEIELKQSKVKRRGRYQLVNAKISIEAYRFNPQKSDNSLEAPGKGHD